MSGISLQIMLLRWWQKTGHKPIALMGGGTTKVGDPSGRDETRQLLTPQQIDANMASIRKSFANYLKFGNGPTDAVMANNADWLDTLLYIPLLRDVGRHFSVNRMLTMDSVKLRLERDQPLTFLEFNYMILQSYDFVELYKRHNCIVQMGGSDQWGNIVMGADLGRRMEGAELFALTSPLLATASGAKMGKSAAGAVWLNPERLSPYDFWQYWRNTEDADVGRFLEALHRSAARRDRAARGAGAGRRSTRPRRSSPPRSPRWRTARQRPSRPPRPRAAPSRKAPRPTRCPPSTCRGRGSPPASRPSSCCTRRDWRKAAPRRAS